MNNEKLPWFPFSFVRVESSQDFKLSPSFFSAVWLDVHFFLFAEKAETKPPAMKQDFKELGLCFSAVLA